MKTLAHTMELQQAHVTQACPPRQDVSSSSSLQQVQHTVSSQNPNLQVSMG
jgi:hypothetical protein